MFEKISSPTLWPLMLCTRLCIHFIPHFVWVYDRSDTSYPSLGFPIYEFLTHLVYIFSTVVEFILDWYVLVYSLLWYPILESKSLCSVTLVVLIFQFLHYVIYRLLWLVHIPLHIHSPLMQSNHSRHLFHHHPRKLFPLFNIWTSAGIEYHLSWQELQLHQ